VNGAISRMSSGRSWYLSARHGVRQLVVVGLEEEGVSRRWGVRRFLFVGVWVFGVVFAPVDFWVNGERAN
jgi:hypothetical protein